MSKITVVEKICCRQKAEPKKNKKSKEKVVNTWKIIDMV